MAISRKLFTTLLVIIAVFSQITKSTSRIPNQNPDFHDHNPIFPIGPVTSADIHDLLPKYGLPIGILPGNVASFTISDEGNFVVFLQKACYVQFDELVYYDKVIKGRLKTGSVSGVSGIQAKKLFVWVPVTGMDADVENGMVEFHVGVLSQKFPAKQFDVVPDCKNKACSEGESQSF